MSVEPLDPAHPSSASSNVYAQQEAVHILSALANRVRLAAILKLIEKEWSVSELGGELGVSQSVISQHLAKLRNADCVRTRRQHQTMFYSCNNSVVINILSELGLSSHSTRMVPGSMADQEQG